MHKILMPIIIFAMVCLSWAGPSFAEDKKLSAEPKVLVEAKIVQVSRDALAKLHVEELASPAESKVNVPLAKFLDVLTEPNAVKKIAAAKIIVSAGQSGTVTIGEKAKYLVKTATGGFEEKTTDKPMGMILEALPDIKDDGNILLRFKLENYSMVPAGQIDPNSSLPIGVPEIGCTVISSIVMLKPGETMIVSGQEISSAKIFILIRAELQKN